MQYPICFFGRTSDGCRLFYNGVVYHFNIMCKCDKIEPLSSYNSQGIARVNVLSIINYGKGVEIGVSVDNVFKKYKEDITKSDEILTSIYYLGGFITLLTRDVVVGDNKLMQNLFVYPNNYNVVTILRKLSETYGFEWRS